LGHAKKFELVGVPIPYGDIEKQSLFKIVMIPKVKKMIDLNEDNN